MVVKWTSKSLSRTTDQVILTEQYSWIYFECQVGNALIPCLPRSEHTYQELLPFVNTGIESRWHVRELTEASGDTSSTQAAATIQRWMHECQERHRLCRRFSQIRSNPDRLLSLTEDSVTLRRGQDLPHGSKYACLSHCWGPKGPSVRLTSETFDMLLGGVPLKVLPKTFRDASQLCLRIGFQYLWIGALCEYRDRVSSMSDTLTLSNRYFPG
jgi:hypothetical protein